VHGACYGSRPADQCRSRIAALLFVAAAFLSMQGAAFAGFNYSAIGHNTRVIYDEGVQRQWHMGESYVTARYSDEAVGLNWYLTVSHAEPTGDIRFGYYESPESAPLVTNDDQGGRLSGRLRLEEP
jgi:hypothetical protein